MVLCVCWLFNESRRAWSSTLGFNYDNRWIMTIVLGCWIVGAHILTSLSLAFINHLKR